MPPPPLTWLGALGGSLLTGHVWRARRPGRAVAVCVALWGPAITGFGFVPWLPAALALLVVAGAAGPAAGGPAAGGSVPGNPVPDAPATEGPATEGPATEGASRRG